MFQMKHILIFGVFFQVLPIAQPTSAMMKKLAPYSDNMLKKFSTSLQDNPVQTPVPVEIKSKKKKKPKIINKTVVHKHITNKFITNNYTIADNQDKNTQHQQPFTLSKLKKGKGKGATTINYSPTTTITNIDTTGPLGRKTSYSWNDKNNDGNKSYRFGIQVGTGLFVFAATIGILTTYLEVNKILKEKDKLTPDELKSTGNNIKSLVKTIAENAKNAMKPIDTGKNNNDSIQEPPLD